MYEILWTQGIWKKLIIALFIGCGVLLTLSYYDHAKLLSYQLFLPSDIQTASSSVIGNFSEDHYLVSTPKCKIINLEPFSEDAMKYFKPLKYKSCSKTPLLTYVTKEDNIATVQIDTELIPEYTSRTISCCYSDVIRISDAKNPDDNIKLTTCKDFKNNVTINQEAILIKCVEAKSKKKIYENVHSSIRITPNVQIKMNDFDNSTKKPLSVLFIGIDSISRLNFIRALPNTYKYVESNGWMTLKGYNKIDDNTFPNLMAILTDKDMTCSMDECIFRPSGTHLTPELFSGIPANLYGIFRHTNDRLYFVNDGFNQTTAYKICNPKAKGFLDKCPLLWYKYRDFGYVTAYAEDETSIGTFNYNKKGFIKPPTDYYFRPYMMATEKLNKVTISSLSYCTGPETAGERILNIVRDFGITFMDKPHFGFFWMNTYSHNEISTPTMMDNKVKTLLTDLENSGVTNSTLIIFLSDHGIRFGDIRLTETGWLEERLPFIYFSFPQWFKDKYPSEIQNFRDNEFKLTTPYDLHMTLQHILILSGFNYTTIPSDACSKCKSLLEEIPSERSCEEASIEEHWCTCVGYTQTKLAQQVEEKLSTFVLEELNKITSHMADKCAKYSLDEISARISEKLPYKNTSYVLVKLKTYPKAIFETTIIYEGDIMNSKLSVGSISRLDYYSSHSYCVSGAYAKKYCYCR